MAEKFLKVFGWLGEYLNIFVLNKIPIARDKQLHFWGGCFICLIIGLAVNPLTGLVACLITGAGKEIWDRVTRLGTPDTRDTVFTWLGGLAGCFILWAIRI